MLRSFVGLLLFALILPAAPPRDWAKHPAIAESDSDGAIYAVGDVHGDYVRLIRLLRAAKIIGGDPASPTAPEWTAGGATVVFLGDLIDKGERAIDVIQLIGALRAEANKSGGQVFASMGNHEATFLADPADKKVKQFAGQLKAAGLSPSDTAACQGDIGAFLCQMPFGVRVRDWFFSHAGSTGGRSVAKLSEDLAKGVDADGYGSQQLLGEFAILEARLGEKGTPWVDSGLPSVSERKLLEGNAKALDVRHIVQGHQHGAVEFSRGVKRKKGQMFQIFGVLFLADTGMSSEIDDSDGAVLHIHGRKAVAICPGGAKTTIWDGDAPAQSGSAKACRN